MKGKFFEKNTLKSSVLKYLIYNKYSLFRLLNLHSLVSFKIFVFNQIISKVVYFNHFLLNHYKVLFSISFNLLYSSFGSTQINVVQHSG